MTRSGSRRLAAGRGGRVALATSLVLSTIVTMLIGELVPKNIALALPMRDRARHPARPMRAFTSGDPARRSGSSTAQPTPSSDGSASSPRRSCGPRAAPTELASLIQRSADVGTLDADTAGLMGKSVEFGTRTAGEIMTPRVRTRPSRPPTARAR